MILPRREEPAGLLHNMSAPPKSVVKYCGLSNLVTSVSQGYAGVFGTPVRFALRSDLLGKTPGYVLRYLGIEPLSLKAAGQQLDALINARANELPLPEGCAVIPAAAQHPVIWADTLTTLAILAKCSDSIWLRSKQPALIAALKRRQVTLLVPPHFAHHLPEASS